MMDSKTLFAKTPILKLFFTAAIPGMISMFAATVYIIFEGMFIGQFLGGSSFAAINLAIPFVLINFSIADLIGVGSSVPIAISLGRKDENKANNIFTCSIIMIFLAAVLMGILMYTTSPILIKLMGADDKLAVLSVKYIRTYAVCGPFSTIVFAMDNYLRISGYIKSSMFLNIFMSALTIGLLYLFIAVLEWGVVGSAFGVCVAMFVCAIIAFFPFVLKKATLKFTTPKFSFKIIKEVVKCGLPAFLNNIAGRFTSIIMNVALLNVGGNLAIATYGVLMYSADLIQPFLYGICDSMQPAIGYNWGAKSIHRVKSLEKCVLFASAIVSVAVTAVMFFFPKTLASLFVETGDTYLLQMSASALKIFCIAFLFRWFSFAIQGFFSAIEMSKYATILSLTSALIFPLIFIVVLWPMGLNGLWLNLAATSVAVGILAIFLLIKSKSKIKSSVS